MKRFADRKGALRKFYRTSETFQMICHNYQKCAEALQYWAESDDEDSSDREKEYSQLLHELELEIITYVNEKS